MFCPFLHTSSKFHATRVAHVALNFRDTFALYSRRSVLVSGIHICRLSSLAYRCVGVFSLGAARRSAARRGHLYQRWCISASRCHQR